jgi:hypothetical protein
VSPAPENHGWDGFKKLPWAGRIAIVVLAVLVALEILGNLLGPLGGSSGRSTSSSNSIAGDGLAAYADLLADAGHSVHRMGAGFEPPDPGTTLVVADAAMDDDDTSAVQSFVAHGGRLVLAGKATTTAARQVVGDDIRWATTAIEVAQPVAVVPELGAAAAVASGDLGSWRATGPALPFLADRGRPLAAVADVGQGRVVLLASAAALHNDRVAEADNAAFGLAIAGPTSRPVVFAELPHGQTGTGIGALPGRWKAALVAGGIAAVLALWAMGRRLGPPEDEARDLPPARRMYVDAMAATLVKTKQPEASLAPLREAAAERLRRRATLAPDASDEVLRAAAVELGLAPDEVEALFAPVTADEQAMSLARAMSRLGGARW